MLWSRIESSVHFTSRAVNGWPFWNFTPVRR